MLDFSDAPYRFFPPRPSRAVIALGRWVNRKVALPGRNHRVRTIEVGGDTAAVESLRKERARLLFVANHSTHSDPQALSEVQRRCGIVSAYMAAYDVFLSHPVRAWVMQRSGAFSVDRDSADRKAIATAAEVLCAGRFALTIFPEGNVYFANDRVSPFLAGAAFIALKAHRACGDGVPVVVVPVSLKFTYLEDVRPAVRDRLGGLARAAGVEADEAAPVVATLVRVGRQILARNLAHRGYLPHGQPPGDDDLPAALRASAAKLLDGLEAKIPLAPPKSSDLVARAVRARGAVHQALADPQREIDHQAARTWADEALLALRILSYCTPYAAENPTLDRVAETVQRMAEDVSSKPSPAFGDRHVYARLGSPIDAGSVAARGEPNARGAAAALTRRMEEAVQSGIDAANRENRCEGGRPF